jgi:serine/threonine protein kinase
MSPTTSSCSPATPTSCGVFGSVGTLADAPATSHTTTHRLWIHLRALGSGGQATVYLAEQHQPPRRVALKVLPRDPNLPVALRQRFQNEGQSAARLDHPHVARVWDFCYDTDPMYLATEYVEGRSLHEALADRRTPTQIAELVARVARGVQHAHERGVIHRDLKPGNVMLTVAGEPKVIDFGMARRDTVATGHSLTAALTQTGHAVGTPAYMAPEQAEGRSDVGLPADVWALGVILYELLSGRRPSRRHDPGDPPSRARCRTDRRPVRRASADLERICRKCLYKEPRTATTRRGAGRRPGTVRPRGYGRSTVADAGERLGRWAGRNPRTAGLVGLIGFVTLLGLALVLGVYITYSSSLAAAWSDPPRRVQHGTSAGRRTAAA